MTLIGSRADLAGATPAVDMVSSGAGGASSLRLESVVDHSKSLPVKMGSASDLWPFGQVLGDAGASARGLTSAPSWHVDADKSAETHEPWFIDRPSVAQGRTEFTAELRGGE